MAKSFNCRSILTICIMGLFTAGCTKTGSLSEDHVLVSIQKTGILNGFVSPAEAKAAVLISEGFFNGREILFDALVDADPVSGKYVIKDIPQGTYTLEMIPSNIEYDRWKIQNVIIEPGEPVWVNICLPKK